HNLVKCMIMFIFFFFFFQAEDGIRDKLVTGVQTCALPILRPADEGHAVRIVEVISANRLDRHHPRQRGERADLLGGATHLDAVRSEERRVGKECRYWWWAVG